MQIPIDYDCRPVGEHTQELRWTAIAYWLCGFGVGFVFAILMGLA
jgi:hypothetical protein